LKAITVCQVGILDKARLKIDTAHFCETVNKITFKKYGITGFRDLTTHIQ
jgi:hypothetical protein